MVQWYFPLLYSLDGTFGQADSTGAPPNQKVKKAEEPPYLSTNIG